MSSLTHSYLKLNIALSHASDCVDKGLLIITVNVVTKTN